MIRKYLKLALAVALLFTTTTTFVACEKSGNENPDTTVPDEDRPSPANETLLELFNRLIEEQAVSGTRDRIFIVAHRANTYEGFLKNIPDNSIPNIEKAIEKGADMVELDVRQTKDNVLILMHNSTIDETTTGTGEVADLTYDEIQQFDMRKGSNPYVDENGNRIKVPTLKEALLACKDRIYVNLDLGGKNIPVGKLVREIQETGMTGQVMLYIGSSYSEAEEYQRKDVNIAVHPFISSAADCSKYASLPGAKLFQYTNTLYIEGGNIGREVRAAGYLSYSNLLTDYDREMLDGDYTTLDAFIASESDFVQTDFVELVDEYLDAKGYR